jgi:hypothetical protein
VSATKNLYNIHLHTYNNKNGSYCINPNSDELISTKQFEETYFKILSCENRTVEFKDMNAYIAHFSHCSIYESMRRRMRKDANNECRLDNLRNTILFYNQIRNTNLVEKYCPKKIELDENRFVPNKMIDINTYNNDYGTNFLLSDIIELIQDSKLNNRKLIFIKMKDFLPRGFNVQEYKRLNTDLQKLTDINAERHFIIFGMKENRKYMN